MKLVCALGDVDLALKPLLAEAAGADEMRQFRRLLWEALREMGRAQQHSSRAPLMQRDERAMRLADVARQYSADVCARTELLNETLPVADL